MKHLGMICLSKISVFYLSFGGTIAFLGCPIDGVLKVSSIRGFKNLGFNFGVAWLGAVHKWCQGFLGGSEICDALYDF